MKITMFMLGFMFLTLDLWALPSLVLSSNAQTFYEGQSEMFVDPTVVVSGNSSDVIDGVRVLIVTNFVSTTDQLFCANPLGFSVAFDTTKGILAIDGSGNIQDYQTVLRSVKYKNTQGNIAATSLKNITMSLGKLLAFKGPDHSTYHYYQFVAPSPGYNWTQAKNAAAASTHFGLQGYLITVTSAAENDFANTKFTQNIWMGASDSGVEGTWKWVTGPESGNVFWMGKSTGFSVGGYYKNWYAGEPNDYGTGEDYAHFWASKNGQWNDYPHGNLLSYIVEYGGMVGDPNINLVDSVMTTVQENRTPTNIKLSDWDPAVFDYVSPLYESTNPPTWFTKIWVTDPDYHATFNPNELHDITFESSGLFPDNNKFSLSGNAYEGYTLTATGIFSYATQTSAHIRLRATEINGEKKHVKIDIVIPIVDQPDPPTITTGLSSVTVNEDSGLLNQSITFADPDTVAANLIIAVTSGNTDLVSSANLTITGNGFTRMVSLTPTANAYGTALITVTCQDDLFGPVATSTMTLTVNPVNDAPTHSTLFPVMINEDTTITFAGAQQPIVNDIDIGLSNMEVSLLVSHGQLNLSQITGLTFIVGDGVSDANMIFQGSLNNVNSALNGLVYVSDANYAGADSLFWKSSDLGNSGSGGVKSVITIVAINITPVNDAPILVAGNVDLTVIDEDSPAGSGNTWQSILDNAPSPLWKDHDAGDPSSYAIVGSDHQNIGTWQTSVDGGVTWSALPSVAETSALLLQAHHRFRFVANSNAFGQANLMIKAWDGSNGLAAGVMANTSVYSATGATSSNIVILLQTIRSINDAPSWTVPNTVSTNEDVPVVLGAMVLTDIDLGQFSANVAVTVWNGTLTLSSLAGLTFSSGDGTSDNAMAFSGNTQNIQLALASSQFTPLLDFNGTALVQVSGNDLGVSGFGGAYASTASVMVLVNEVNDPPVLNLNVQLAFVDQWEDQVSSGNRVQTLLTSPTTFINAFSDVDRLIPFSVPLPDGVAISSWSSDHGHWQVSNNGGGTWTNFPTDDGREYLLKDDSSTLIRFLPFSNYYGTQTLRVRAWDQTQGSSGSLATVTTPGQGTSSFSGNQTLISLNIRPLNDMPQVFTPVAPLIIQEDAQVIFSSAGNSLSLYDVESTGNNATVLLNLYTPQGSAIFPTLSGVTTSGTSSNIVLSGNIGDINRALDGLQWQPHKDYFGFASLIISLNDQDSSQNVPLTISANVGIQVLPVNDSPVIGNWNSALTYVENNPLGLFQASAINISDVDDAYLQSANVQVTTHLLPEDILTVTTASTSISAHYDSVRGVLTLSGVETVVNYNVVINSLIFNHLSDNPNREGSAPNRKLVLTVYDASSSANLEIQMAIQTQNDAPQIASWDNTPKYKEDDVALVLDSTVILTDSDSTLLQGADVQLTPFMEGDKLQATATANIAVSWNSTTGKLTLSGPATPAEFSGVLQAMTYISSSVDPDQKGLHPTRTCALTATDGISMATASIVLSVQSINDAPSLSGPFSLSGNEDQSMTMTSSPITVMDVDDAGGDLQLSLEVSHGNLMLTNTTGLTVVSGLTTGSNALVVRGSKTALNASLLSLMYAPEGNYNGSDSLKLVVNDLGNSGEGGALEDAKFIPISLTPVNDAPILPALVNFAMNSIDEDNVNSAGNMLLLLLTVNGNLVVSDVDLGTNVGIAVTTNPSALDGIWQYSLNAGGFWQDFPVVSFHSAVLLGDDALLRFLPKSNYNGSANLIFHAWDRSSGHGSGASGVAMGTTGGQSAFSINTGEISLLVRAVNDSPILTVPPFQELLEDNSKVIMGVSLQDVDLLPTDMVQITMSVARGTLSVGGGLPSSTLVLTDTLNVVNQQLATGLVYNGQANDHGTVSLNMTASDLGQHGIGGAQVGTGLVVLNIDEVNDAPVLNTAMWSDNIAMLEDDTNHAGWAPGIWCNYALGSLNDIDLNFGDNVWNNTGIAITSLGSEVKGRWEQSLNKGGQWLSVPNLSSGNVLLLSLQGDHRLRFVPEANANGNVNLKFRAWDRTVGVPGEMITLNGTGGTTAYSTAEKNMILEVQAVNDAPTILTATLTQTANEDENIVFSLSQMNGLRLEDVDLIQFPDSICQLELSLSQANIQLGTLTEVQILDGNVNTTSLRISGNLSALSQALNGLTLIPFKDWHGKGVLSITFHDLGQIGSDSLFDHIELEVIFLPVNDAPQWLKLDGDSGNFSEGDLYASLDVGNDLDIIDGDSSDFMGGRMEIIGTEQGTWEDRLLILEDSDLSTTGGILTYLGNIMGTWKDISQGQAALTITFSTNSSRLEVVKAVAKNIRFANTSKNPSSGTRKFKWLLDDGDGGQARADVILKVSPVNNDPVFVLTSGNNQIYREDQGPWSIFSGNLLLSDPDSLEFSGGVFVLEWVEGQSLDDIWQFSASGNFSQVGSEIRFIDSPFASILSNNSGDTAFKCRWLGYLATPERILEMLAQLMYLNNSQKPDVQRRLLKMSIGDGDGGLSAILNVAYNLEPINDAPKLQLAGAVPISVMTYVENSPLGLFQANALNISDVDDAYLQSANVQVITYLLPEDILSVTTANTSISSHYDSSRGVLTLSGVETVANYNAVLNSLVFNHLSDNPDREGTAPNRKLVITAHDASSSANLEIQVAIQPQNDAPQINSWNNTPTYKEDDLALVLDSTVVLTDLDSTLLQGAYVQITPFVEGDKLEATATANISITWNGSTGRLTLTGPAKPAEFSGVLQAMTYISSSVDPDQKGLHPSRTCALSASDGISSAAASIILSVQSFNDAPSLSGPFSLSGNEDQSLAFASLPITVVDIDDGGVDLQLSLEVSHGNLIMTNPVSLTVLSGLTLGSKALVVRGSKTALNASLLSLSYDPEKNYNGSDALKLVVNDLGNSGAGGALEVVKSIPITITPLNDAPILPALVNFAMNSIDEDNVNSAGNTLLPLLTVNGNLVVSDIDLGASVGIAVTTNPSALDGVWQYSINAGGFWQDLPAVSFNGAVLLGDDALLRFVPKSNYNGSANLIFHAWDRSSGHGSGASGVALGTTGGQSAFSIDTAEISLLVRAVNDSPILTVPPLQELLEDNSKVITGISLQDVDLLPTDTVQITMAVARGTLSVGGGLPSSTLVLTDTLNVMNQQLATGLVYNGQANDHGTVSLNMTASDFGQHGTGGAQIGTGLVILNIDEVNDAPVLNPAMWSDNIAMLEDDTNHAGWAPGIWCNYALGSLNDIDLNFGDNVWNNTGIAITSLGSEVKGRWEQSPNKGGQWLSVPSLSSGNVLLLSLQGDHRLRFVPEANANGNVILKFRAWDRTVGLPGEMITLNGTGGTTAYSTSEKTMVLEVQAVNDAPTILSATLPQTAHEDENIVFKMSQVNGLRLEDVDLSQFPNSICQLQLSLSQANIQLGTLVDVQILAGNVHTNSLRVSGNLSALSQALNGLTLIPYKDWYGKDVLSITLYDLGQIGSESLFHRVELNLIFLPVNDAPEWLKLDGDVGQFIEGDLYANLDAGSNLDIMDVDSSDFMGGRLEIIGTEQGSREDRLLILEDSELSTTGGNLTYLGNLMGNWKDIGQGQAALVINFSTNISSLNAVKAVANNIRFSNPSQNPSSGTRKFKWILGDGDGCQVRADVSLRVFPVNDDPVFVLTSGHSQIYREDQGPWSIFSGNLLLNDLDSLEFNGGIFGLEWVEGQSLDDIWQFSASGNFSLVGSEIRYLGLPFATILGNNLGETAFKCRWLGSQATPQRILEMLAQLVYRNDSQKPEAQRRLLKMSIGDGDGGFSASQNVFFTLEAINDAPVLQLGGVLAIPAILEDSSLSVGWTIEEILAREQNIVSDVDAHAVLGLALQLLDSNVSTGLWEYRLEEGSWKAFSSSTSHNVLLLRTGDRLRFTPARDWNGLISPALMVRAWDRSSGWPGECKTVTETGGTTAFSVQQRMLSLSVTGVPDAPVIVNGQVSVVKYASRPLLWSEFSALFSDVDGDSLQSVIIDVLPTHGDLTLNSVPLVAGQVLNALDVAKLVYIPRSTFTGFDNFRWRATDSQGTSVTSSVFSIEVLPIAANISLSKNHVSENVGTLKVVVTLSVASISVVRLELQQDQGSLVNYKDMVFEYSLVEFPVGTTVWEKELIVIDDIEVEATETTDFRIANAQFCDIGVAVANLSVQDNDVATSGDFSVEPQIITEWLDPAWVRETGASARLSVRLSQNPVQPLTMSLQSSDVGEGVLSTGSLSFNSSNWSVSQVITVTGVPDQMVDGNIKAAVMMIPSDPSYRAEPVVFTNIDMDSQGLVRLEALPLVTSEDGAQTMLLFTLQTQPSSNVILTVVENTAEHQLSSSLLTFTSQNWNSTHVLIVKGLDNSKIEGDRFVNLSWLPTVSNDVVSRGLGVSALDILQKDNDGLNASLTRNLPPYRLILKSDVSQSTVNAPVMITFGAEDPELNMGLRGGLVDFVVDLNTGSGFKRFEALQGTTFAMNFREAGIYKLELRAMDLLGAISLKQSTLVIHRQDGSPFLSEPTLIQRTVPAVLEWKWRDFVKDSEESSLRLIEWDINRDGIIDWHGYPSDPKLNSVSHRFDQAGQFEVLLRAMNSKGEVFSLGHRIQVLASGIAEPLFSVVAAPDSIYSPAKVTFQASLGGTAQTISRIDWSFGEEMETLWDVSGNSLVAIHAYQKPGTYAIRALATLSDGQTFQARTDLHLSPPIQPAAIWTGMSARLPWTATVGFGFPLQVGVWPPQGQLLSLQHVVTNQQGLSLNSLIANLNLAISEGPFMVQSSGLVSFYGANYNSNASRVFFYRSDFVSQQGPFAQNSTMALPWSGNTSVFVQVHDGSSLFAPLLQAQGQGVSVQLLKDSGLTTQGLPSHLRSIYRDVRFLLTDGQEIQKPTQPIVLELAYDDGNQDGFVDGYGVSENELIPMRFDHDLNRWVEVEYYMVHPVNNVVRVKTAHLSEFGLFIRGKRDVLMENNSGGGCLLR